MNVLNAPIINKIFIVENFALWFYFYDLIKTSFEVWFIKFGNVNQGHERSICTCSVLHVPSKTMSSAKNT